MSFAVLGTGLGFRVMPRVFISYRRADNRHVVGRIYDRLVTHFGPENVFKDVDSIPLGVDFRRTLEREIGRCHAVLVVIGQRWLRVTGTSGLRRLDEPNDFVRAEIEIALGRKVPVIPLLVDGARIPAEADLPESIQELAYRNGVPLRADPDFHADMDRVLRALDKLFASRGQRPAATPAPVPPSAKVKPRKKAPQPPPERPTPRRSPVLTILWFLLAAGLACLVEYSMFHEVDLDAPLTTKGAESRILTTGSWKLDPGPSGLDLQGHWFDPAFKPGSVWTFTSNGWLHADEPDQRAEYSSQMYSWRVG